jgi:FKBP-type peptidyl-prolyl cis-trans isomerase
MSDDIVELSGNESANGRIRLKLDIDLPHDEAMAILGIVHDFKDTAKKQAEAERRRAEAERRKAAAAAKKAAKAEAAKAKKASAAKPAAKSEDSKGA